LIRDTLVVGKPCNGVPVALVSMPWGSVLKPPVGISILKRSVELAGFVSEIHLLNMNFAEQIGLDLYECISDKGFLWAEWFFSQALFGPQGSGELQNGWSRIEADPDAADLVKAVREVSPDPGEFCSRIMEQIRCFLNDCLSQVHWAKYTVVGFTTTFAQSLSSLLLAKHIKDRWPEVKIVFGGANVDSEMGLEFLRSFPWIDYIVHGEAETTFPQLLNEVAFGNANAKIDGISMRHDGEVIASHSQPRPLVDLNQSPPPDYSDYLKELERRNWRKPTLRLYFESSRGCWWGAKHHCTFCGLNGDIIAFRRKDSDRVCREIKQLAEDYRCLHLAATDNILPLEYMDQLLPQLADMDVDFDLFYEVKANLNRKHLRAMAEAGVRSIQPGIESFNSSILALMRKGTTAIQNVQLLKWCREYEIEPLYNIIFGFPGETAENYEGTSDLMGMLSHLHPPQSVHELMFQRFSPYDFEREKLKVKLVPSRIYRFIFPQKRVHLEQIAYYFEGDWEGRNQDLSYILPVVNAWRAWESQWKQRSSFCYYEKGPNYVVIYDNRKRAGDSAPCRRILLGEHVSAVYLFCDEIRSRQSILNMMASRFGSVNEGDVSLWLEQLVLQGLMMQEEDRYLALATRKVRHGRRWYSWIKPESMKDITTSEAAV
jgi:ribosomal peptide maturation radical SAM protein 1